MAKVRAVEVQRCAFIVRVWTEDDGALSPDGVAGAAIRGSIQRVDDQAVRYFASLDQVVELMAEMLSDEQR